MWRAWGPLPFVVAALALLAVVVTAVLVGTVYGHKPIENAAASGQWGGLLAFALLCGLISFAVLEMAKRLLPIREQLQRRYVRQWWDDRARSLVVSADRSWAELMEAMGHDAGLPVPGLSENGSPDGESPGSSARDDLVFGLPIQLLAAQISTAADLAVAEPEQYGELYCLLTRSPADARVLRQRLASLGS